MQYRNDFHNDSKPKHRNKPTQCTCYKNTTTLHVSIAAAVIYTILRLPSTYMPNQRINTAVVVVVVVVVVMILSECRSEDLVIQIIIS